MKILEYDEKLTFKSKYYDEEAVFLDIETTGLSPMRSFIYLIGLVFIDLKRRTMHITQLIAENKDEEEEILKLMNERLEGYKTVVTYNGNSFDLPFIKKRAEIYGIEVLEPTSFDMYEKLRLHKDTLNLDGLKQKKTVTMAASASAFTKIMQKTKIKKVLIDLYFITTMTFYICQQLCLYWIF